MTTEPTPEEILAGQDLADWAQVYEKATGTVPNTVMFRDDVFALRLEPGTPGYIVIRKPETRRQRLLRWLLRRPAPVEVYPVTVKS